MENPLHYFLNPQSVAMIGVSPNPSFANAILNNLVRLKYAGAVYPINPNYKEIAGLPAYARLTDVPGPVDLVIVSVPSRMTVDVLGQCEQKEVKAVNILTSGFSEIAGAEGQRRQGILIDFVKRTGIRIVGPNCFGNISVPSNFAGMAGTYPSLKMGRLSLAYQSGGLAINVVQALLDRQIGFAHVVSSGNEADVEVADCIGYFVHDEHTHVIGCFVEQFRNPQKFIEAAEMCADAGKPIVMLKVGRSEAGQRAAQAHTGSLAGSDKVIDAVLKRLGVIRVYSLDEMVETAGIMHTRKLPKGDGVGAITFSGGAVGFMSDLAADVGVKFPAIADEGRQKIQNVLYEYGTVNNPIDLTGQAVYDPPVQQAAFEAMGADPNIHTILVFAGGNARMDAASPIGKVILGAVKRYPDKIFVRSSGMTGTFRDKPLGVPDLVEPVVALDGVPFLQGAENTLRATASLIRYGEFQRKWRGRDHAAGGNAVDTYRVAKARGIIAAANGSALTEAAGKQVLALYGIPTTREGVATTADEAAQIACEIGFPVAMKIVSPQIMHKTDAGGVLLNMASEADARAGYEQIMNRARRYNPQAELHGVSVQEMVGAGHEIIVGMTRDTQFGPGILVGLGGIFVEVLRDVAVRVPPLDAGDAREMIGALKGKALLAGARGAKPADLDALAGALVNFSQLCMDLQDDVREIDVNPLIVFENGKGVKAVDCLMVPA
ncbi:MAG: acetate--CoA ligase family protein [Chloroflexi bacterium]|nr:acetate--CoA ligase family protein [Chloroflexota bacterium]